MTIQQSFENRDKVEITVSESCSGFYRQYGKRMLDVALAVVLLPFLILLFIFVRLAYLRSGKAIFVQLRVGKNGNVYRCYKFRTMHVNAEQSLRRLIDQDVDIAAEWNAYQKLTNDPRITKIGSYLRKSRLDEFPQLVNVLIGEMSFVGPRPFTVDQLDLYKSYGSNAYFYLRPGITGYWQLDQPPNSPFCDRPRFDHEYCTNISFSGDLKFILRTSILPFNWDGK